MTPDLAADLAAIREEDDEAPPADASFPRLRGLPPWRITRLWPHVRVAHDEVCNPWLSIDVWPLGAVEVRYGRTRTWDDGPCEDCRADHRSDGLCEWCGSRPCWCDLIYPAEAIARRTT